MNLIKLHTSGVDEDFDLNEGIMINIGGVMKVNSPCDSDQKVGGNILQHPWCFPFHQISR